MNIVIFGLKIFVGDAGVGVLLEDEFDGFFYLFPGECFLVFNFHFHFNIIIFARGRRLTCQFCTAFTQITKLFAPGRVACR
jgi:hypothetical protein